MTTNEPGLQAGTDAPRSERPRTFDDACDELDRAVRRLELAMDNEVIVAAMRRSFWREKHVPGYVEESILNPRKKTVDGYLLIIRRDADTGRLAKLPEVTLGPAVLEMEARGVATRKMAEWRAVEEYNAALQQVEDAKALVVALTPPPGPEPPPIVRRPIPRPSASSQEQNPSDALRGKAAPGE